MKPLYMTGVNNYVMGEDGPSKFYKMESAVVLEQRKDGSSSIVFLSDKPTYKGQPAYVGTNPKFNDAALKLQEA